MKKAFEIFYENNKNLTEKNLKISIKHVLRSYQIQVNMGISQISAFENSLLNPTLKKTKKVKIKEEEIKNSKKKQCSPKFNRLHLYESELNIWIEEGISMRKIRIMLWKLHRFKCSHETIRKYVKMVLKEGKLKEKNGK